MSARHAHHQLVSKRPPTPPPAETAASNLREPKRINRCPSSHSFLLLFLVLHSAKVCGADGLFADFSTSLGRFTCELQFDAAPKTAANFVGLATGERLWVHPVTGRTQAQPFYDGLTFHRVIAGFMNQSGSPNGQGTDGPGYAVLDEFSPALRHDRPGVLSMANSGPNSNGSQFFITVAAATHLDHLHSVFGQVVEGMDVVDAINAVATDADDRPLAPVIIEHVAIRRVGPAAEAFDIHAQSLPTVSDQVLDLSLTPEQAVLTFTNQPFADLRLSESFDLQSWNTWPLGIDLDPPGILQASSTRATPAAFFSLTRIQYPDSTRAPRSLRDTKLSLEFAANQGVLTISFDATGGGSIDYSGTPGTVENYTWIQDPYRGHLWPVRFSNVYPMTLRLDFTRETEGTFVGTVHPDEPLAPIAASGTFTLTPL